MLIPPRIFKLAGAASKDATRYQLTGIHVERNGTPRAVATDGKILGIAKWKEDDRDEFPDIGIDLGENPHFSAIVPTEDCKDLVKLPPKRSNKPILRFVALEEVDGLDPTKVRAAATDLDRTKRHELSPIDGTFPDVEPLEKRFTNGAKARVMLNINYLEQAIKCMRQVLGITPTSEHQTITCDFHSEDTCVVFSGKADDGVEVQMFIMPLVLKNEDK